VAAAQHADSSNCFCSTARCELGSSCSRPGVFVDLDCTVAQLYDLDFNKYVPARVGNWSTEYELDMDYNEADGDE
ncbi:hypothetical protein LINPERPRIM_LOCUS40648, partial [Linum perenne]